MKDENNKKKCPYPYCKWNTRPEPKKEESDNIQCPVCGYYCLGKGGHGCIDKPSMLNSTPKVEGDLVEGLSKFIHKFKEHLDLGQSCRECRHEAQAIADYIKEER